MTTSVKTTKYPKIRAFEDEIPRRHRSCFGFKRPSALLGQATTIHEVDISSKEKERMMATTNAFDLLILPILVWTAGIYTIFALIRSVQLGIGRLFGSCERRPEIKFSRGSAHFTVYRQASPRPDRPHVRAVSPSR